MDPQAVSARYLALVLGVFIFGLAIVVTVAQGV